MREFFDVDFVEMDGKIVIFAKKRSEPVQKSDISVTNVRKSVQYLRTLN
jgi:hypothetical protein